MPAISQLQPHRTIYLRGFDRRGCAAAISNASASGFTVSGVWSDIADFAILVLFDEHDIFGHLTTTRYLPNGNLTGVVLDFDLAITNGFYPGSLKFQSVPWGKLSWINGTETAGVTPLNITSVTGGSYAQSIFSIGSVGTDPTPGDIVTLIYLSNVVGTYTVQTGDTASDVATGLADSLQAQFTSLSSLMTAAAAGVNITVASTDIGIVGNAVNITAYFSGDTYINTPGSGATIRNYFLTGGVDPTSIHVTLDFSAMSLSALRQCWLTLAPPLSITGSGLQPFESLEFSYVFSNVTVTDVSGNTALKIAGPGSVVVPSFDRAAKYAGASWAKQTGFYYSGLAQITANPGDSVSIVYNCQHTHDLYVGTQLETNGGKFTTTLDGTAAATLDTYALASTPFAARRLVAAGVAAGKHALVLTVSASHNSASGGTNCLLDFLQAAVLADPASPSATYPGVNLAYDFDTQQTYNLSPERALWVSQVAGFSGDIDFFAGVFFALKRIRVGGNFHAATITVGAPTAGDSLFINLPPFVSFGVSIFSWDTADSIAQRFANYINATFVGIWASESAGVITVTTLSPINGFDLTVTPGASTTLTLSGDVQVGNEGIWGVDDAQASPLNRAFVDYLADFATLAHAAGQTVTVAFSQELLGPPDANTSGGAWSQRFASGNQVLTATAFGTWGAGVVEAFSGSTVTQTGHGYITGNIAHIAPPAGGGSSFGVWVVTVTDADHYDLTKLVSGGYSPSVGDMAFIELQTTQCNFNPATTTAYLSKVFVQAANIMAGAGLTPWLQFGEVGWWFFSEFMSELIGFASFADPISIGTASPHGLSTGQTAIVAGVRGNDAANGTWPIAVTNSTHFTETGSIGNGDYIAGTGTVSGGGMAYYDAYTASAASSALGRSLASFWTQDDSPAINSHADANFLRTQVYTHMHSIWADVLAAQSGAKAEWLLPMDVDRQAVYWTKAAPFPQGGRMNNYVNIPTQYMSPGSDISRLKIEALSWIATYGNLDLTKEAIAYGRSALSWPVADTACIVAWFNGFCQWQKAYLAAANDGVPLTCLFAIDHFTLLDQPLPLPVNGSGAKAY